MQKQAKENIIHCYNQSARDYADKYGNELSDKHFDRLVLQAFAAENKEKGRMIDLGCGPGQTTAFLSSCGIRLLLGIDIAEEMVKTAAAAYPSISFECADMLDLRYSPASFGSALAFYSIVHFDYAEIGSFLTEVNKILRPGGDFLFSFHTGQESLHMDHFLGHPVNIDFHFFDAEKVKDLLIPAGFSVVDSILRDPYPHVEYPSRRAYIWARKQA